MIVRLLILIILIFKICEHYKKNIISDQDRIIRKVFELSPNQKISKISNETYIIDNFYKYPEEIRKLALKNKNNFKDHTSLYLTKSINPFLYSDISYNLIDRIENILWIKIDKNEWDIDIENHSNGYIQYLTKDGNPTVHHDKHWTLIIFLSPNPKKNSGTSLYKHKKTGIKKFMKEDEIIKKYGKNKFDEFIQYYEKDLWNEKQKPQFDKWEKIFTCENVYNRALLFDGRQWHCSDGGFGENIDNSRLFQTFFLSPFYKK
jgi:hypothetical protein